MRHSLFQQLILVHKLGHLLAQQQKKCLLTLMYNKQVLWQKHVLQKVPRNLKAEQRAVELSHSLPVILGCHPKLPVASWVWFSWRWESAREVCVSIYICRSKKVTYWRLYLGSLHVSPGEHHKQCTYLNMYTFPSSHLKATVLIHDAESLDSEWHQSTLSVCQKLELWISLGCLTVVWSNIL